MTIDEAIKRLGAYLKYRKPDPDDNFWESVQLGIEALKVVKEYHSYLEREGVAPLPGETKD